MNDRMLVKMNVWEVA